MHERVPAHVESVCLSPSDQEQIHNAAMPVDTSIVEGRKTMLVPTHRDTEWVGGLGGQYSRYVDVILWTHGPLLTIKLISITTGREDVLTGSLWTQA